ncbi:MAG TPA: 3-phosphoshikimate 1-carboxyvinyltransferase [bacterium]|nr:3-phosphoshikimate 1-carboxyvinyltransferase [bacterium]
MKKLIVSPAQALHGTVEVPGDKSVSHRSIMMGALASGETQVQNFLASADCLSTLEIFKKMGVKIRRQGDRLWIQGRGLNGLTAPKGLLNAGNSGTTARILMGLLSGQAFTSRLTGDKYLRRRPMKRVVAPLALMGARISGSPNADRLPLTISPRKLKGITYDLPIASAQVKSAILMAGLFAEGVTRVTEPALSRDHTERMFQAFGIPLKRRGLTVIQQGPAKPFKGRSLLVPGDISSAAFFIVAALIVPGSKLLLKNVGMNPSRTGLIDVLLKMGARIKVFRRPGAPGAEPAADLLVQTSALKGVVVEGALVPRMIDEFPILAVAATQAKGLTVVRNAEDLKVKESDRILMMALTLQKMGADIEAQPDGWVIKGGTPLSGARLSSGGDHRVAMSLAVAALIAKGPTTILDTENINTSFPNFEKLLKSVAKRD